MARPTLTPEALFPEQPQFMELARSCTLIPVCRRITADLETPVSAFLRIAAEERECFLLESVEGGERLGRYTFIGIQPYRKVVAHGRTLTIMEGRRRHTEQGDIFAYLKEALSGQVLARFPELPPFTAGAVGFFAYDVVRQIERLPELAENDLELPDACLAFFHDVLVFDHVKKEILLIATADVRQRKPEAAYRAAVRRIAALERRLQRPLRRGAHRPAATEPLQVTPRTSKADFMAAVERVKEYIAAGDVFQTVLSQRFDVVPDADPFAIYRALRIVNPSPYLYFLRLDVGTPEGDRPEHIHIIGSSPELLVRIQGRKIEYRPIAGTRGRSPDAAEDQRLEEDLRGDAKEIAEHVMLVDLGRNDVGRVSEYGSVRVRDLMFVERYSHVMHLVSAVEGRLREGLSAVDAFRACFPAGTLSGAPKVRAMEIIEELEPTRRGIYGGSICYADFSGNLDSCIAIRSMLMKNGKGYVQAGAGIVADSVPEKEFEECVNKASAVLRAIERARRL